MAGKEGKKIGQGTKRPRLRYFYLNQQLHKKLLINRGRDLLTAWNYPEGKRVTYTYTDVLRRHEKAFTTAQVCEMLNRSRVTIEWCIIRGDIEAPQHTYGLDEDRKKYQYLWHEKDILALHDYLCTVHKGRPRNDGEITPMHLPTPRELRAMINDENVLYIKQGDMFIPSWRAKDF